MPHEQFLAHGAAPATGSASAADVDVDPEVVFAGRRAIERDARVAEVLAMFDAVVESSKTGVRKPGPRFYAIACELLGVEPHACVFLDDLGVNLKPARDMGMVTIKVIDPAARSPSSKRSSASASGLDRSSSTARDRCRHVRHREQRRRGEQRRRPRRRQERARR